MKYYRNQSGEVFAYESDGSQDEYIQQGLVLMSDVEVAEHIGNGITVPSAVSMRQARLALLQAGLLDQVDAALAAIPDATQRKASQIEWEYATEVVRDSPLVASLSVALGLTSGQLNDLFTLAATL